MSEMTAKVKGLLERGAGEAAELLPELQPNATMPKAIALSPSAARRMKSRRSMSCPAGFPFVSTAMVSPPRFRGKSSETHPHPLP